MKGRIEEKDYIGRHKMGERSFVRHRKLKVEDVIYFVLTLTEEPQDIEIMRYFEAKGSEAVSAGSMSKARAKLRYTAFEELFHVASEVCPAEEEYKGYRVLAVDGMSGDLPCTDELRARYPPGKDARVPKFHSVSVYDVLNEVFTDVMVKAWPTNENASALELVGRCETPAILLFDRGFPSVGLIQELNRKGQQFVMRVSRSFLREVNELKYPEHKDTWVHIDYSKRRAATNRALNVTAPYEFDLRCIQFELPSGQLETLVTNLPDSFTTAEFGYLYNLRWGIETGFNYLKNAICIEAFMGRSENAILQEFFASLITYNLCTVFTRQAQGLYDEKKNFNVPKQD